MPTLALLMLFLPSLHAVAASPNLAVNSSFEIGPRRGGQPNAWQFPNVPPEGALTRDLTVARTGQASIRLTVPEATKVDWYQATQDFTVRRAGEVFTFSAYLKAEGIHGEAGAYCSIGYYNAAGVRLSFHDSQTKLSGTSDWVRQVTSGPVPPGAAALRMVLTLYGRGTVWFDDVQLEGAESASPYQPSMADTDTAARQAGEDRAAREFVASHALARHPGRDVAILRDTLPAVGAGSSPEVLAESLGTGGFHPVFVTCTELANAALLSPDYFDLLVLPYGAAFPAAGTSALQGFLAAGGSFISSGGYAFDAPLVEVNGQWLEQSKLPDLPGEHPVTLHDFQGDGALQGWGTGSFRQNEPRLALAANTDAPENRYLHVATRALLRWDTITSPPAPASLAGSGWSITTFRARGDANTHKLAVEWHEHDGSRWKSTVELTPQWKTYRLPHTAFRYWPDNPSVGRGGPTDRFHPENAEAMMFGLAEDIAPSGGDYAYDLDDIGVEDDPLLPQRMAAVVINTRTAPIRDAMWPTPEQVGAFDPSAPLQNAAEALAAPDQFCVPAATRLEGPFTGYSATAVLGLNGHGFGPDRARWQPLLLTRDRFSRPQGALGALVHHYSGAFQGSSWAIFGADNADVFAPGGALLAALPGIARAVTDKLYLHGTEAEYACYRRGEDIRLLAHVANHGPSARQARVRLEVCPRGTSEVAFTRDFPVTLEPGDDTALEATWTPPPAPADLYDLRATLLDEAGKPLDAEVNLVVIWDDEVVARGPRPVMRDSVFEVDGRPLFMMGTQNWWGQNGSTSARSPLKMETDYAAMQDSGLSISRCFLSWGDERAIRASDAWVYLAQKHHIVQFHTPNLFNSMDNATEAQQERWAREIAQRYRDVPGLIVDLSNEPYFVLSDEPNMHARFNEYLSARYGTDEALRAAWATNPPEAPLPEVPCGEPSQVWGDRRASDLYDFAMQRQGLWARRLQFQVHDADPALPVSVGFMQGFGWRGGVWDPVGNSLELDFTDRHYYGGLPAVPAEIKEMDLRWLGKPLSIGECGAKAHPSFADGNMGEDSETFAHRFMVMGHLTFGMGGSFMASWHWRDPMEGIFPCGLARSEGVPRLAQAAMRNMALMFAPITTTHQLPRVYLMLPDLHRLSARRDVVQRATRRATDLLVGLHVPFETVTDACLDQLPASARAVFCPVPYALSDATFDALERFVQGGGALYLSGDLTFDEAFERTRAERLERLCGLRLLSEVFRGLPGPDTPPNIISPTPALPGIEPFPGWPGIRLESTGAVVLATEAGGGAALSSYRLGEGRVWFSADPLELGSLTQTPARAIYQAFLQDAGISRDAVTPDVESLHAFILTDTSGGSVRVIHNVGPTATVAYAEAPGSPSVEVAEDLTGLLWQDAAGRLLAAEGQGAVTIGGRLQARFEGHAAAVTLDGAPLAEAQAILVLPFREGAVQLASTLSPQSAVAVFGQVEGGRWRTFEQAPLSLRDGLLTVTVPEEHRTSLLLICERDQLAARCAALAQFVTRRTAP